MHAQVAFFKSLIELSKTPPPWLRMVNKRGTFFLPLDPRRPPSVSLPKLLKKCAPLSTTTRPPSSLTGLQAALCLLPAPSMCLFVPDLMHCVLLPSNPIWKDCCTLQLQFAGCHRMRAYLKGGPAKGS